MKKGFTLAELLIALAILGVIATFTIPKVLQSQQSSQWNSAAKEVASMLVGAYDAYKATNTPTGATSPANLTPYMNYVSVASTTLIDAQQGVSTLDCSTATCLRLHNGGIVLFDGRPFGNTASTNAIVMYFDPDGKVTNGGDTSATASGKSVQFWLYYNDKLRTGQTIDPNTCIGVSCYAPAPGSDPPWFSWS